MTFPLIQIGLDGFHLGEAFAFLQAPPGEVAPLGKLPFRIHLGTQQAQIAKGSEGLHPPDLAAEIRTKVLQFISKLSFVLADLSHFLLGRVAPHLGAVGLGANPVPAEGKALEIHQQAPTPLLQALQLRVHLLKAQLDFLQLTLELGGIRGSLGRNGLAH